MTDSPDSDTHRRAEPDAGPTPTASSSAEASLLDFELPEELIAQRPAERRDGSRLLQVDRTSGACTHRRFAEIVELLSPSDLLVLNDTAVFPARLRGRRSDTGGKVELLLLEPGVDGAWLALLKTGGKPRPGTQFSLADGALTAQLEERLAQGHARIRFPEMEDRAELDRRLDEHGEIPLPPYIAADAGSTNHRERYQTVFARHRGAVAAPTAGLHFTDALLDRISERGVEIRHVTLHVGLGTFQPIHAASLDDHVMHSERYHVPPETGEAVDRARAEGRRIIACGTTSVRTLEARARTGIDSGETDLFLRPGDGFEVVRGLITNFHLPHTTLLLLVAAFLGVDSLKQAYAEAIRERYRFYSYGDAMLIL